VQVLKNILVNWVLPVVLLFVGLAGLQLLRAPDVKTDPGGEAPGFTLLNTDGVPVSLADFRGQDVIVNFWGTWCGPCKAELPGLNRFAKKNPEVVVLGLALDSGDPKTLKRAKKKLGIQFEVLDSTSKVKQAYGISSVPTTFHVDAAGILQASHVGIITPLRLKAWTR
jgi:peroxiredoxin